MLHINKNGFLEIMLVVEMISSENNELIINFQIFTVYFTNIPKCVK